MLCCKRRRQGCRYKGEQCDNWYKSTLVVLIQGGNETKVNKQIELTTSQNDEHQQKRLDLNDSKLGDKLLNNTSPAFSEGVCETKTEDPRPKTDDPIFN